MITRPDLASLLVSLQLSDSAFPSGLYTMPHGLEGFRQAGLVEQGQVEDLLRGLLLHLVGPGDATALARAHEAAVQAVARRLEDLGAASRWRT